MTRIFFGAFALVSCAVAASLTPADRTVTALLITAAPTLQDTAIVKRLPVSDELDLVVAIGWPRKVYPVAADLYPWSPEDRIGLFLQDRVNPGRVFQLAVEPGPNNDCTTRVERITAQDLVLSCVGENGPLTTTASSFTMFAPKVW